MSKLQLQKTCFENIKSLCTNYKKDSSSRKTQDYLNKRLSSLNLQWKDFDERHNALVEEIQEKNIHYFVEDVYNKTKELYESTERDMQRLLQNLQQNEEGRKLTFDLTGMSDEEDEKNIRRLLNKQECNFKAIDRALSKINIETMKEKWELEDHLSILKNKWEAVDQLHWELDGVLQGKDELYYNTFTNIEREYDEMRRLLNNKIWANVHLQQSTPRIEIPEFSGNYHHWISFKDLFQETIHNNPTINKAQKMQHLKTKLRGEALKMVQHLTVSAENYDSCWDILGQRYDNRRLQFSSFMNTMLNLPVIQNPDANNMKRTHDVITECLNGLTNIGLDITTWDPIIVHLMSQKLDSGTYNEYIKELQHHRELPTLSEFLYFLETKFMAYENMKNSKNENYNASKKHFSSSFNKHVPVKNFHYDVKKGYSKTYHTYFSNERCPLCEGGHVLMQCSKFVDMNSLQRNSTVSKLKVCKNCLFSHGNAECKSTKTCKECNMKHHTLLHNAAEKSYAKNSGQQPPPNENNSSNHLSGNEIEIVLTTIQIKVKTSNGTYVTLRALLDQGSQVNLITENAAQLLQLPRKKMNATISGVGAVSGDCKGRLQLTCQSIHSGYTFDTAVLVMKKLTNNLPNSSFEKANWPHLENLKLADPQFNVSSPIDLLLGAEIYSDIILDGVLRGDQSSPIAQQTRLGWILCGKMKKVFSCHATLIDLSELTKFWEHEDIQLGISDTSKDDHCEEHYGKTVTRAADGKFTVEMPLHSDFVKKLGHSKSIAISQFIQLEKRLEKNKKLALMYRDFIREYIDLGHMKPATPVTLTKAECYLPHHGVLRESSTTTKLRVVFNASQKTTSGYSLNSVQEKGPNLQRDIQALILKWRSYQYAFTADIEKMYRGIWIATDQQPLQKIIWRDSPSQKLQEFQLCTITYGMKCAPWLAMRTLQQLATEEHHRYPAAANTLKNEFYVDDLVSGHTTLYEAKELQLSLINLLKSGGMNLRKWSANHPALLENLSEDQISTQAIFDFKHEDAMKTLGLGWNTHTDNFVFNWDLKQTPQLLTKRTLLSEISTLYDPLGWLSPITVTAKLLFQRVWLNKLGWDEVLPNDIQNEWSKMRAELHYIKNIKLPRWIGAQEQEIELLGFCDASEKAYSCVIYSRVTDKNGLPTITLYAAKTRVAPLAQKTTLPRLELCGALLLSQLMEKTKQALSNYNITIQAWCDSQVVLAWLQGDTSRWEKYVANRVTKIKQIIPPAQWHYVKSEQNPADCASRGMYPNKFVNFHLWWDGPEFLKTIEKQELNQNAACLFTTNIEKATSSPTTLASKHNEHFIYKLLNNISSLTRVVRIMAWVLRFSANARNKSISDTSYLTASELTAANEHIIRYVQQTEFMNEYNLLTKRETVSNKSKMFKLNPYMDKKGMIRVGGRLNNSYLPFEMKNPIILSHYGRFTQLLIDQAHLSTLHGGARLTLAEIRQRYWIVGGNRAVKTKLRHCIRCHRHKPVDNYQLMGDLPQQRTTPSRPFTHTGVDFTGHVEVKLNKGKGVKTSKGYIAIFVCMTTKAVHIELVSDLSTETFLAAFQRMCARRGTPKHLYSDCGTNFIGAEKMLRHEFEQFLQILPAAFFDEIEKMEVNWHFNHLRRVLGDQKLTYEEFTTLLTKIEACMNSRPLCPLTEDPEEFYNCLTPGHFLTGSPTMSLLLSDYSDDRNIDLRRRWQLTEHMLQQFWKNWTNEYLSQLQTRCKWNKPTTNIKEGDIVLVKENNLPPGKWALGRVLELHPGPDGYVRVTTLKTQTGTIKRPIVKLSPLPFENDTTLKQDDSELQDTTRAGSESTSAAAAAGHRAERHRCRQDRAAAAVPPPRRTT